MKKEDLELLRKMMKRESMRTGGFILFVYGFVILITAALSGSPILATISLLPIVAAIIALIEFWVLSKKLDLRGFEK